METLKQTLRRSDRGDLYNLTIVRLMIMEPLSDKIDLVRVRDHEEEWCDFAVKQDTRRTFPDKTLRHGSSR